MLDVNKFLPQKRNYIGTGNRCSHSPSQPECHLVAQSMLGEDLPIAMQRFVQSVYEFYYQPAVIPALCNASMDAGSIQMPGFDTSEKRYGTRSDGRDALTCVLLLLLKYTDFSSFKVGMPLANGSFMNRSFIEIADELNMVRPRQVISRFIDKTGNLVKNKITKMVPNRRFERAIEKLINAGILTVSKRYETQKFVVNHRTESIYKASTSEKILSADFISLISCTKPETLQTFINYRKAKVQEKREAFLRDMPELIVKKEMNSLMLAKKAKIKQSQILKRTKKELHSRLKTQNIKPSALTKQYEDYVLSEIEAQYHSDVTIEWLLDKLTNEIPDYNTWRTRLKQSTPC